MTDIEDSADVFFCEGLASEPCIAMVYAEFIVVLPKFGLVRFSPMVVLNLNLNQPRATRT